MPMLLIGCDGGTNATSGVVPEITRKLYDLTLAGRIDEARELQYKLVTLFDAMIYSADFPEGFRAALKLRGIDTGREPAALLGRASTCKMETISRTLACLLAEEGFADEPVGGCPVGAERVDPEQVGRIVQGRAGRAERSRAGVTGEIISARDFTGALREQQKSMPSKKGRHADVCATDVVLRQGSLNTRQRPGSRPARRGESGNRPTARNKPARSTPSSTRGRSKPCYTSARNRPCCKPARSTRSSARNTPWSEHSTQSSVRSKSWSALRRCVVGMTTSGA